MNRIVPLLTLGLALCLAPAASATIIFHETFEGQDLGALPASATSLPKVTYYDPAFVTGLVVSTNTGTSLTVKNDGGLNAAPNKYLELKDTSATNTVRYAVTTSAYADGVNKEMSLQFDFLQPATGDNSWNLRLGKEGNANTDAGPDIFFLYDEAATTKGRVAVVQHTGGTITYGNKWNLNTVNTMLISVVDGKYSLTLNGELLGSDLNFRNSGVTAIEVVGWFQSTTGQGTMYIDNIIISNSSAIPEPASLALIGAGGALMLLRRRRAG
jgi:hypothetical protein